MQFNSDTGQYELGIEEVNQYFPSGSDLDLNALALFEFLLQESAEGKIKERLKNKNFSDYDGFIFALQDVIQDVTGKTVEKSLLRKIPQETYELLYPNVANQLKQQTVGKPQKNLDPVGFYSEFQAHASDPFVAARSIVSKFKASQYADLDGRLQAPKVDAQAGLDLKDKLSSKYVNNSLDRVLEYQTEIGARRLTFRSASESALESTFNRLKSDTVYYEQSSGFIARPTDYDMFSLFAGKETDNLSFRGYTYQVQNTAVVAAVLNRAGSTVLGTQQYDNALDNDGSLNFTRAEILAPNQVAIRTAEILAKEGKEVKGYSLPGASLHAKVGYFTKAGKEDVKDKVQIAYISTQNITPALSKTTTVEEMLVFNRNKLTSIKDETTRNARLDTFNLVTNQLRAVTDSLLQLTGNSADPRTEFGDKFKTKLEGLGVQLGDPKQAVFVNDQIHKKIGQVIKSTAESTSQKLVLTNQYIEGILNPNVKGDTERSTLLGHLGDLTTLAQQGRISIALTGTSHGQGQGLFYLLDQYYELKDKVAGGATLEGRAFEKYNLLDALIKNDSFTVLPSQYMHSKSFAVFDEDENENRELVYFGLGSANLSGQSEVANIETSVILDRELLGALDDQTQQDISNYYWFGASRFFDNKARQQGLMIEGRRNTKVARLGIDYLKAMGGVEARTWEDTKAKDAKFIYSKRYTYNTESKDYELSGAIIQVASPFKDKSGYSFDVTFGGEYKINSTAPEQIEPIIYLNKTQRVINGMVFKNSSQEKRIYKGAKLNASGVTVEHVGLFHGESYQANAFDVLGGLIETMGLGIKYEYQVRALNKVFQQRQEGTFESSLRKYLGATLAGLAKQQRLTIRGGNYDLNNVAYQLSLLSPNVPKLNVLERDLITMLSAPLEQYGDYILDKTKTAEGRLTSAAQAQRKDEVQSLVRDLFTTLRTQNTTAITKEVKSLTDRLVTLTERHLNIIPGPKGTETYTGLYNDLIMSFIDQNETLSGVYKTEVEEGKKQGFSLMVDIFPQPHELFLSHSQGLAKMAVYGEDSRASAIFNILRGDNVGGFIMNPYPLMHGESLGFDGEYLRSVAGSTGRLFMQKAYDRHLGLGKLEGGAPVVYEMQSLMQSMPGLSMITRQEYKKRLVELGISDTGVIDSLISNTFSRYNQKTEKIKEHIRNQARGDLLLIGADPDDVTEERVKALLEQDQDYNEQLVYFFPYAKTEQISQRMKNLTSTRPLYQASKGLLNYIAKLGGTKYDASNLTNAVDGNVLPTLAKQQYESILDEYARRKGKERDQLDLRSLDVSLLKQIATELSVSAPVLGKGYMGVEKPRRMVIASGAVQISDWGAINAAFGEEGSGQRVRYVAPHVIQETGQLSSLNASSVKMLEAMNQKLRPGALFLAKDLVVEDSDVIKSINQALLTKLAESGVDFSEVNADAPLNINDLLNNLSNTDPEAKTKVREKLKEFKRNLHNLHVEVDRENGRLVYSYTKGVYSPPGTFNNSDDLFKHIESMRRIGDIRDGSVTFGLYDLFGYTSDQGDARVQPLQFAVPAFSSKETGLGVAVLTDFRLTVNKGNTYVIDASFIPVKDQKDGTRLGTTVAKGPWRSMTSPLWRQLGQNMEHSSKLLPSRISQDEVFAMLSAGQIKGFNFEMGLTLLEEQKQSGIYEKISGPGGGKVAAQALALLLTSRKENTRRLEVAKDLATSLNQGDTQQYAQALQLRIDRKEIKNGAPLEGLSKDLSSSLDFYSELATLVDTNDESIKTALAEEGLEAALSLQISKVLRGKGEGGLQTKVLAMFDRLFNQGFKSGDNRFTHIDDYTTRPAGLLAFLVKASTDLYKDVDIQERLQHQNYGELILSNKNVFTQAKAGSALVKGLQTAVTGDDERTVSLKRLLAYEQVEKLAKLVGVTNDDKTKLNVFDQYKIKQKTLNNAGELYDQYLTLLENNNRNNAQTVELNQLGRELGLGVYNTVSEAKQATYSLIGKILNDNELDPVEAIRAEQTQQQRAFGDIIKKLTDLGVSEDNVRTLLGLFNQDDVIKDVTDTKTGLYSALQLYGQQGELGRVLGTGQAEMARRFGFDLPKQSVVKSILDKMVAGQKNLTDKDNLVLEEVEGVFSAIRTYIQAQRFVEMPGDMSIGKLTVPAGMKNTTGLEGHIAQSMTAKQLALYTYSQRDEADIYNIQRALVSLAMVYEGVIPSSKQINDRYRLEQFNLGTMGAVKYLQKKDEDHDYYKAVTHEAEAAEFSYKFLTNYTIFGETALPGKAEQGDVSYTPLGTKAISSFIREDKVGVEANLQSMREYADITRRNVGDNLDYETQINRRVKAASDKVTEQFESLLSEKVYKTRSSRLLEEVKARVTASHSLESTLEQVNNLFKNGFSVDGLYTEDMRTEEVAFQKEMVRTFYQQFFAQEEDSKLGYDAFKQAKFSDIYQSAIKSTIGGLEQHFRDRIEVAFNQNSGAEYLKGLTSLYYSAEKYYNIAAETRDVDRASRAKSLMNSLNKTKFISLPALQLIDKRRKTGENAGAYVVARAPEVSEQTGVILGLDILQKMSLLFQTESHVALEAQHKLVAQLARTQSIIDRVQEDSAQGNTTSLTYEEYERISKLRDLMEISKVTAIDLINNKNSIRQSTGNRLAMSGTSFIAMNSFLVGMAEVGLGDRINKAAGTGNASFMRRYGSVLRDEIGAQIDQIRAAAGQFNRGPFELEVTLAQEIRELTKKIQQTKDEAKVKKLQEIVSNLVAAKVDTSNPVSAITEALQEARENLEAVDSPEIQSRLRDINASLAFLNNKQTYTQKTNFFKFGRSEYDVKRKQAEVARLSDYLTGRREVTKDGRTVGYGVEYYDVALEKLQEKQRKAAAAKIKAENQVKYLRGLPKKLDDAQKRVRDKKEKIAEKEKLVAGTEKSIKSAEAEIAQLKTQRSDSGRLDFKPATTEISVDWLNAYLSNKDNKNKAGIRTANILKSNLTMQERINAATESGQPYAPVVTTLLQSIQQAGVSLELAPDALPQQSTQDFNNRTASGQQGIAYNNLVREFSGFLKSVEDERKAKEKLARLEKAKNRVDANLKYLDQSADQLKDVEETNIAAALFDKILTSDITSFDDISEPSNIPTVKGNLLGYNRKIQNDLAAEIREQTNTLSQLRTDIQANLAKFGINLPGDLTTLDQAGLGRQLDAAKAGVVAPSVDDYRKSIESGDLYVGGENEGRLVLTNKDSTKVADSDVRFTGEDGKTYTYVNRLDSVAWQARKQYQGLAGDNVLAQVEYSRLMAEREADFLQVDINANQMRIQGDPGNPGRNTREIDVNEGDRQYSRTEQYALQPKLEQARASAARLTAELHEPYWAEDKRMAELTKVLQERQLTTEEQAEVARFFANPEQASAPNAEWQEVLMLLGTAPKSKRDADIDRVMDLQGQLARQLQDLANVKASLEGGAGAVTYTDDSETLVSKEAFYYSNYQEYENALSSATEETKGTVKLALNVAHDYYEQKIQETQTKKTEYVEKTTKSLSTAQRELVQYELDYGRVSDRQKAFQQTILGEYRRAVQEKLNIEDLARNVQNDDLKALLPESRKRESKEASLTPAQTAYNTANKFVQAYDLVGDRSLVNATNLTEQHEELTDRLTMLDRIMYGAPTERQYNDKSIDTIVSSIEALKSKLSMQLTDASDEIRADLNIRITKLEEAVEYVKTSTTREVTTHYFKLNIKPGLDAAGIATEVTNLNNLINYIEGKLASEKVETYRSNIAHYKDKLNLLAEGQDENRAKLTASLELAQKQLKETEARSANWQSNDRKEQLLKDRAAFAGLNDAQQDTFTMLSLLSQEKRVYENYTDLSGLEGKLADWAETVTQQARIYRGRDDISVTSSQLFSALISDGNNVNQKLASLISGEVVSSDNAEKRYSEIEETIATKMLIANRQGAPSHSGNPADGNTISALTKDRVGITEVVNVRAQKLGSYFVADATASSTLMLISAFGFEFTGLGDYDGDSFQAALTNLNKAITHLSIKKSEATKIERSIANMQKYIDDKKLIFTEDYDVINRAEEDLAFLKQQLASATAQRDLAAATLANASDLAQVNQQKRIDKAYTGLRSYISSFLALPKELVGSSDLGFDEVYQDDDLRGLVKQFRDTVKNLNQENSRQIGKYAYIKNITLDNQGKAVLSSGKAQLEFHDLGEAFDQRAENRVTDSFSQFVSGFESSSYFQEYQTAIANLDQNDRSRKYKEYLASYQTEIEAAVMAQVSAQDLFKNVTGTIIDPGNLSSLQAVMGQTGGSLLGKVFNTVVPISAQIGTQLTFQRTLSDPEALANYNKAVVKGFKAELDTVTDKNVRTALEKMRGYLTQTRQDGVTPIPWQMALREQEEQNAVSYRLLLTAQQFLRDTALKPKEAGGLSAKIETYQLHKQSLKTVLGLNIGGISEDDLTNAKGLTAVLALHTKAGDKQQDFINTVMQDFLGSVANRGLEYSYKVGSSTETSVDETKGLTAFAALKLLTDYVGSKGLSGTLVSDENYQYGGALISIKNKFQADIDRLLSKVSDSEVTRLTKLKERVTDAKSGQVDDDKLVKYLLSDMLGKFQSQFIIDSMLEKGEGFKIEQTERLLQKYGLSVDRKGKLINPNNSQLNMTALEGYTEDVLSYLNYKDGLSAEEQKSLNDDQPLTEEEKKMVAVQLNNQAAEDYKAKIRTINENTNLSLKQKAAQIEKVSVEKITNKYGVGTDVTSSILGQLKEEQNRRVNRLKGTQQALVDAMQGNTYTESKLIEVVHGTVVEHETTEQVDKLVQSLDGLKRFNEAINRLTTEGDTRNSVLIKTLKETSDNANAAVMDKFLSLTGEEFTAQQYALDAGRVVGDVLPKVFSNSVLTILDAVETELNRGGFSVDNAEDAGLVNAKLDAIFGALAMGGTMTGQIQKQLDEATAGLTSEVEAQAKTSILKALVGGQKEGQTGSLRVVAEQNAYRSYTTNMNELLAKVSERIAEMDTTLEQAKTAGNVQSVADYEASLSLLQETSQTLQAKAEITQQEYLQKIVPTVLTEPTQTETTVTPSGQKIISVVDPEPDINQHVNRVLERTGHVQTIHQMVEANVASQNKLEQSHVRAEGISLLAVPLIFATMQGDIPVTQQISGFALDVVQSALTTTNFEGSTLNTLITGSFDEPAPALKRTQAIADRMQFGRMQQYLMNYGNFTEGLARAFTSELIYGGSATLGSMIGKKFDSLRGEKMIPGETGIARLTSEIIGGTVGIALAGMATQTPIPDTIFTEDEYLADVSKTVTEAAVAAFNYLSQTINEDEEADVDFEDADTGSSIAYESYVSDARGTITGAVNTALTAYELSRYETEDPEMFALA